MLDKVGGCDLSLLEVEDHVIEGTQLETEDVQKIRRAKSKASWKRGVENLTFAFNYPCPKTIRSIYSREKHYIIISNLINCILFFPEALWQQFCKYAIVMEAIFVKSSGRVTFPSSSFC